MMNEFLLEFFQCLGVDSRQPLVPIPRFTLYFYLFFMLNSLRFLHCIYGTRLYTIVFVESCTPRLGYINQVHILKHISLEINILPNET